VDLAILSKFHSEARDELVVPLVVGALATSLNEEQLAFLAHVSSSGAANQRAFNVPALGAMDKLVSSGAPPHVDEVASSAAPSSSDQPGAVAMPFIFSGSICTLRERRPDSRIVRST
jgi:hypothetical protein